MEPKFPAPALYKCAHEDEEEFPGDAAANRRRTWAYLNVEAGAIATDPRIPIPTAVPRAEVGGGRTRGISA